MKICNKDMQQRYSIETSQDHPKKSTMYLFYPLSHLFSGSHGIGCMLQRYATVICNKDMQSTDAMKLCHTDIQ